MHGVPDVHPESRPFEHGPGPGQSGADDPPAGAGAGQNSRQPALGQRDEQSEGTDPQALRDGAQQAPRPGEHHGTGAASVHFSFLYLPVQEIYTPANFPSEVPSVFGEP